LFTIFNQEDTTNLPLAETIIKMEPPEDAKNITRGFPPVKREYLGDPDVKYLLPRFPAMSNKDYELSGDGRLTGRFHENMEVWRNREKQQQEVRY
jgi:hypothetical protein